MRVRKRSDEMSIEDAAVYECTPLPYCGGGVAEDARETAEESARMLGRLIEVLAQKGVLTAPRRCCGSSTASECRSSTKTAA